VSINGTTRALGPATLTQVAIRRARALLPTPSLLALIASVGALLAISLMTYRSMQTRAESALAVSHTNAVRKAVFQLQLLVERAQGAQRGFLLTGNEGELAPLELARASLTSHFDHLHALVQDSPAQLAMLDAIRPLVRSRLEVIDETVRLRRAGDAQAATDMVARGRGRVIMQQFHDQMAQLLGDVEAQHQRQTEAWEASRLWSTYVMFGGSAVLLGMALLVGYLSSRDYRRLEAESWVRRLQLALGERLQADLRLESLGEKILSVVVPNLGAQVGAIYVSEPDGLRRIGGHALPEGAKTLIPRGEGLAGQAALGEQVVHLEAVPEGYLDITSATGRARPRQVVVLPAREGGEVQAVVELGFLRRVDRIDLDALGRLAEAIAIAIRTARDRSKLEELLGKTQRQAEELQTQQEELRVTNEELEQQSRALQLSQAQLENQQTELEQINTQLEEQASSLERQRDELSRAGAELQRANEHKSQFLANMSHELRTPLNSSLILAKLLADNREGNLSAEQIKFASTIYSAGNDLLTLINDILDLSKIEAGRLDVRSEPIAIERLLADLGDTFQPLAAQKQLSFERKVAPGTAASIETDPTRLLQILKNLLANAFKFTERGGVTLELSQHGEELAFAVRDTGIGIAADQQEIIFEPFRQADSANTRKFGGTGLGLSISRDLARLLGGDLRVESAPGRGSTFTLVLPLRAPARARALEASASTEPLRAPAPRARPLAQSAPPAPPAPRALEPAPFDDDRGRVTRTSRTLLVIEDDVAFARILYDLAHELDFLAVVATTADGGLALARELAPSAIVLDVGLPDHSGLAVLDALKRDARTRHVPVHVISGHDHTRAALEMGAVGYALKPVEREQLAEAIKKLEARFTRKLRRVLVVEDDPTLRESTARLLATGDVETVTAGTAAEALALLGASTFDCMVLDLELPDRSGLELLEEMARGEQYSFPPVIVYTGRSLSSKQVHELERFSRSIIIKGARSPERLLDEVTLFLHQVESELPPERQRMLRDVRDREAAFEGRRILIVEDDVRNVFALTAVLEPRGAEIAIARNGREALEHLAANPNVHLVLMDIMMPEMDGLTATRELRKDPRFAKLPIIVLTAKAMADDREKCFAAGANDYIAKPLDVDKLLSLARVWIRK
jgi:signal transduction histidine kinase/DNA-binding response OmpR family regulator